MEYMPNTKDYWLYPCIEVLWSAVLSQKSHMPLFARPCKSNYPYITSHSHGDRLPQGKLPVLSFSHHQSYGLVRCDDRPIRCLLLFFSTMTKFLITVFMGSAIWSHFVQIFFQRDYIVRMNIECFRGTHFLFTPLLPKPEKMYSRGLAIRERSIKQKVLCRTVHNSCKNFTEILYGTIFLR